MISNSQERLCRSVGRIASEWPDFIIRGPVWAAVAQPDIFVFWIDDVDLVNTKVFYYRAVMSDKTIRDCAEDPELDAAVRAIFQEAVANRAAWPELPYENAVRELDWPRKVEATA